MRGRTFGVAGYLCAAALALLAAGRANAQAISGLGITNSSSSDVVVTSDPGHERKNVLVVQNSAPSTFTTRYSGMTSCDVGLLINNIAETLTSNYSINFSVTAPGGYSLAVSHSRRGDLNIRDEDAGAATADISGVTGAQSGGTISSGALNLADPGSLACNGCNLNINQNGAATITGVSNGVAKPHSLSFAWSSTTTSNYDFGVFDPGGDESAVRLGIAGTSGTNDAHMYPGSPTRTIGNDGHFVTVTLTSLCGNGVVDAVVGEQCDLGGANGTAASCCLTTCLFRGAGQTCRATAGACDVVEVCTGAGGACPSDDFQPFGIVCRAASAGQECDESEVCPGGSANCPADGVKSIGTGCRNAADLCDLAEACDGSSKFCPADVLKANGILCASDSNPCTLDQCNGSSAACQHPAGNAGTQCRAAAGVCDVAENCTGSSPTCPVDGASPNGTTCTADMNPCTLDQCDGSSTACQHPAGNAGTQCRAVAGDCDVAESCTGSSPTCPTDGFASASTVCRVDAGACDVQETCSGSAAACPGNAFEANGTPCSDGAFCNGGEQCQSGICQAGSAPCGGGQSCDESADQCFAGGCPLTAATCRTAGKSKLLLKDSSDDSRDKLIWKWGNGAATSQLEFSNPTATSAYALCLYAGPGAGLIGQADVPANASTWAAVGTKGYKYKDTTGSADGIQRILVKGSTQNKSKALVKGRGAGLLDLTLPIANVDLPLIVQLRNNGNGLCFESTFLAPSRNSATQLKAKTP